MPRRTDRPGQRELPSRKGSCEVPPSTTELVIRNEIPQLALLSAAIERIGREHALAQKPLVQLQVTLDEIVSNVIKYAWPEGGSHEIRIRITVDSGKVKVDVADDGMSFDPRNTALHAPPPSGQRRRPGGVGLHMVRQLMDSFEYTRIGGWNHSTLTKQCTIGTHTK
jgi:anti-sigma regulatory factor (Ser/Thr protein kinase)